MRRIRRGDVVDIVACHVERYTKHDAYSLAELESLEVVSVHGGHAKVQTAKGEALGLIPLSWLTVRAEGRAL